MGPRLRTISEACKSAGLQIRTLRYLHERGYLQATWLELGGQRVRVYDDVAVERIGRISALLREGFPPRIAAGKAGPYSV